MGYFFVSSTLNLCVYMCELYKVLYSVHTCTPELTHMYSIDTHALRNKAAIKMTNFYVFLFIILKFIYSIILLN